MTTAERYAKEWAGKVKEATRSRNRWMLTMSEEGASVRRISDVVGLPAMTVNRILHRMRAPGPPPAD